MRIFPQGLLLRVLLVVVLPGAAWGQIWAPLQPGHISWYSHNDTVYAVYIVASGTSPAGDWRAVNTDNFHFHNPTGAPRGQTIRNGSALWPADTLVALTAVGQWLLVLPDQQRILLHTADTLGHSWLADTLQNITGTIVEKSDTLWNGLADSLLVVAYSNGLQIWVSKALGLMGLDNGTHKLRLIRYTSLSDTFGLAPPSFRNTEPVAGDTLDFRVEGWASTGPATSAEYTYSERVILQEVLSTPGDSVFRARAMCYRYTDLSAPAFSGGDSIYSFKKQALDALPMPNRLPVVVKFGTHHHAGPYLYDPTLNLILKENDSWDLYYDAPTTLNGVTVYETHPTSGLADSPFPVYRYLGPEIGYTAYDSVSLGSSGYYQHLVGVRKADGRQFGQPFPSQLQHTVSRTAGQAQQAIQVYPTVLHRSGADFKVYIALPTTDPIREVALVSVLGVAIPVTWLTNGNEVLLPPNLPAGAYYLRVTSQRGNALWARLTVL